MRLKTAKEERETDSSALKLPVASDRSKPNQSKDVEVDKSMGKKAGMLLATRLEKAYRSRWRRAWP